MDNKNIYGFNVNALDGDLSALATIKIKCCLIVNTASECGFTPQLKDLEDLKRNLANKDFEILAFPSNDFGGQEPLEGRT
jgi:glutathione peroxidase